MIPALPLFSGFSGSSSFSSFVSSGSPVQAFKSFLQTGQAVSTFPASHCFTQEQTSTTGMALSPTLPSLLFSARSARSFSVTAFKKYTLSESRWRSITR